ncbi:MAG: flagellar hook-length control protein FliK [Sulfuricurvum sp.]|nr:flagellar hook-length control protein FliK [Sulfuricurvum sp.]
MFQAHTKGSMMIMQSTETKTQSSLADLLGGNSNGSTTQTKNTNDLFSKLLASLSAQTKGDTKGIVKSNQSHDPLNILGKPTSSNKSIDVLNQATNFTTIIDPKNSVRKETNTKSTNTGQTLQTLLSGQDENNTELFSKDITNNLSTDQMRMLIYRAKEFLKNEIATKSSQSNLNIDVKTLPKTLGGLIQLADNMGLNPASISLSSIITDKNEQKSYPQNILSQPLLDTKALNTIALKSPPDSTLTQNSTTFEGLTQLINDIKAKETKTSEAKSAQVQLNAHASKEVISDQPLKSLLQTMDKRSAQIIPSISTDTTQKPIETKPITPITKTEVSKTDGLLSLLHGENKIQETKSDKTANTKDELDTSKIVQTPKPDSFEVKTKEAQQSMRYFATDLKEVVDNYKPPFTRVTMKLNPEKLGEVEVTLVQRGNNVHVNIQSNNTNSVNFLAQNAMELKTQLTTQGITNTTMNFMSSGGDGQTGQQTFQQQQQQQQNRFHAYESLNDLELNNEQLSALEIIIPHYA